MRCRFVLRSFSIPLNLLHNFSFYCYYLFLSFRAPSYEFHFLLISIGSSDVKALNNCTFGCVWYTDTHQPISYMLHFEKKCFRFVFHRTAFFFRLFFFIRCFKYRTHHHHHQTKIDF